MSKAPGLICGKVIQTFLLFSLVLMAACTEEEFLTEEQLTAIANNNNSVVPDTISPKSPVDKIETIDPTTIIPIEPKANLEDKLNTFVQSSSREHKVDILWVIDNSGSMGNNQDNLSKNFESFINNFLNRESIPDFQMAVVTTDPRSAKANGDGKFVKNKTLGSKEATADKDQFVKDFQQLVRVGTTGSGNEANLNAALRATQRQKSFFRDEAILVINILSDEFDYSLKLATQSGSEIDTVEEFVSAIQQSTTSQRVIINSIVNLTTYGQYETRGEEQLQATALTNGIASDILGDFDESLNNIGEAVLQLADSFPLSHQPYEGIITVYIDGQKQLTGWNYDSKLNTVTFDNAPQSGSSIEIQYQIEAQPEVAVN